MVTIYALFICSLVGGQSICDNVMPTVTFTTLAGCEEARMQYQGALKPSAYTESRFVCMKRQVAVWSPAR